MNQPSLQYWLADLRSHHDSEGNGGAREPAGPASPHPRGGTAPAAEDLAVVEGLRNGDAYAFERLYVSYYPRLYPYAADRVGDASAAAEIVHDVFLALWRRRTNFKLETTLTSYLYVAVRNRALNVRKVAARDATLGTEHVHDAEWDGYRHADAEADVAQADLVSRIWQAVDQLPGMRREAITLRWRHGLQPEEIAGVLGVSVAAAKMHVSRALQALRVELADLID